MSNRSRVSSSQIDSSTRRLQHPVIETSGDFPEQKLLDVASQLSTGAIRLQPNVIDTLGMNLKRRLLDIDELEEVYGIKRWTTRSYCSQRRIPFIKIGRRVYFDPVAIEAWIQGHARPVKEVHIL